MKTRDRILNAAIALFNAHGTAAVSTNHIAEAAGISPGNLYYHFRNKEEIIRAAFERLYDAWDTELVMSDDDAPTLDDLVGLVRINFDIMSRYQFVYRELVPLLRHDPQLAARHRAIRQRGFEGFQDAFAMFTKAGILRAASHDEIIRQAELCWLVSEFWLASLEINGDITDPAAVQHGIDLILQVLRPESPPSP